MVANQLVLEIETNILCGMHVVNQQISDACFWVTRGCVASPACAQ